MTTPSPITDQAVDERSIVLSLIELASAAFLALDDSEEREGDDGREYVINSRNFDAVSEALDRLDFLPDDKPGYTLAGPGRAEWALRGFLSTAQTTGSAPDGYVHQKTGGFIPSETALEGMDSEFWRPVFYAAPASPAASVLTDEQIETAATHIWDHFGPDHEMEWKEAANKDTYRSAARAAYLATRDAETSDALSPDERVLFESTVEQFADCNETDTDYAVLMDWVRRGFLQCMHFEVTAKGNATLAAGASKEST